VIIAVISDMHGNGVALEAALKDVKRQEIDRIVCLGDAIQGGSQPAQVIERLQALKCPVIMGNGDNYVLTGESAEPPAPGADEVREWTREQIGPDGLDFVASFQSTLEIDLEAGRQMLCFHGSPRSFDDVILPETADDEVVGLLGGTEAAVLTGGHTHLQWARQVGDSIFFNPGSAGVTYNRHMDPSEFYFYPFAEYAVIESEGPRVAVEFCRVPFDVDELHEAAIGSGRPYAERESPRYRPPRHDEDEA